MAARSSIWCVGVVLSLAAVFVEGLEVEERGVSAVVKSSDAEAVELRQPAESSELHGLSGSEDISASRVAVVIAMFSPMVIWLVIVIKFACDGSLPARLALWGLLPEVAATVSVRAIIALLRLKKDPTPAIVLRRCVDDVGAEQLAIAMRSYGVAANLQVLEIPFNPALTERGLVEIVAAVVAQESKIQELDLSYNAQFGDLAAVALKPLLSKASKVNVLKLAACSLGPAGLEVLADGLAASKLRTLDLAHNDLAGTGPLLATICEAPVLEEIVLSGCGLTAEDVRNLAEQLPYTSIRTLQLGGNGFGSAGLCALAEHLSRSHIDTLGLEGNKIGSDSLSVLGAAWAKRPFARISLKDNEMSTEDLQAFLKTLRSCV